MDKGTNFQTPKEKSHSLLLIKAISYKKRKEKLCFAGEGKDNKLTSYYNHDYKMKTFPGEIN